MLYVQLILNFSNKNRITKSLPLSLGPFSTPLAVDGNAWAQISGGSQDWPDLQILLMSVAPNFDFGFAIAEALGYKREARKTKHFLLVTFSSI